MISYFTDFIELNTKHNNLVVQPRMGFRCAKMMRQGLQAVRDANATTVGTLTLDSYTRVGDYEAASKAIQTKQDLNGYPIVSYGAGVTTGMLEGIHRAEFPVQVRHGTALPLRVFQEMAAVNIDATEGGPVSYCLPYSRLPLQVAIKGWEDAVTHLASCKNIKAHIESFAGCMLGQLCPPSLLIALNILEAMFFKSLGITSVSLSFAEGTNIEQDYVALQVLRKLANKYLHDIQWHVVVYTYMGVFPGTYDGANRLIADSAQLAQFAGCERLIVKTPVESQRIPSVQENIESLELAASYANKPFSIAHDADEYAVILNEAESIIQQTLAEHNDIGQAFLQSFQKGQLDVPYCLHANNKGIAKTIIDERGYLKWADVGNMPIALSNSSKQMITSKAFMEMLSFVKYKYDDLGGLNDCY